MADFLLCLLSCAQDIIIIPHAVHFVKLYLKRACVKFLTLSVLALVGEGFQLDLARILCFMYRRHSIGVWIIMNFTIKFKFLQFFYIMHPFQPKFRSLIIKDIQNFHYPYKL